VLPPCLPRRSAGAPRQSPIRATPRGDRRARS